MNEANLELASQLVPGQFLAHGAEGARQLEKKVGALLAMRQMPEKGWPERDAEALLLQLGALDCNARFTASGVGLGEREGRVKEKKKEKVMFTGRARFIRRWWHAALSSWLTASDAPATWRERSQKQQDLRFLPRSQTSW
jgi:hypothetical protein